MGQALYRKYRPKRLSEVIGQKHITNTLETALKSGRLSHAYLFTGPRGVGKTSVARILAHEINNIPYDDDSMHIDIIEIDAASNRRIDEIRELRDKVYVAPTSAKYKVYIIDEVHMLTREAFNALLKTLEEPPQHVIFILATTDAHKLPETIISRTQRFTFKPVETDEVASHLRTIAKQEKIKITDDALRLLAEHGEGSFRDSISLLDQASSYGQSLELSDIQRLLGLAPTEAITQLLAELASSNSSLRSIAQQLSDLFNQGFQAADVARQLAVIARDRLVDGTAELSHDQSISLLAQLIEVPAARDPQRFLELALFSMVTPRASPRTVATPASNEPRIAKSTVQIPRAEVEQLAAKTPKRLQDVVAPVALEPEADEDDLWSKVLSLLKQEHNTLYGVVRMAEPRFTNNNKLELTVSFAFHHRRLSDAKNQQIIADSIKRISKQDMIIDVILKKESVGDVAKKPVKNDPPSLSTISDIFGGGEILG